MTKTSSDTHWRLDAITIRHFRGVADELTVRFDGRPALIYGNNGVGKSTVAHCLQWTLYGKFPESVLANRSHSRFLAPAGKNRNAYSGEVTFRRGLKRITFARNHVSKFTVFVDGARYKDAAAEEKRDELLGLDMDTFVRTVLLQQSRIRGILLDDPRERNRALDRLLGLDAVDQILEVIKPQTFSTAAQIYRTKIESDEAKHNNQADLLLRQEKELEQEARGVHFLNKDFSVAGLKKRYEILVETVTAIAEQYDVPFSEPPACENLRTAAKVSRWITGVVRSIQSNAKPVKQLVAIERRITKMEGMKQEWQPTITEQLEAESKIQAWMQPHGPKEELVRARDTLENRISSIREDLKQANALRQLLLDASAYIKQESAPDCPVCEQHLPSGSEIVAALEERARTSVSDRITDLEASIRKKEQRLSQLNDALGALKLLEDTLRDRQRTVENQRRRIQEELGLSNLPETKVAAEITTQIEKAERRRKEAEQASDELHSRLDAVCSEDQSIQSILIPVLKKREELSVHDAEYTGVKATKRADIKRASKLDRLASAAELLRKTLFLVKQDLATESLKKARPRALQLYRVLVRHPFFDTLSITTAQRSNKMDYDFVVGAGGTIKDRYEARLMLSDGQLTATALGLFFALAESTAHGLNLLYVDDPTQNLDLPCKEAMAKVIADLAKRKQIIVSTHDEDFVTLLESEGFGQRAVVHHIDKWDGNPTFKTTTPNN